MESNRLNIRVWDEKLTSKKSVEEHEDVELVSGKLDIFNNCGQNCQRGSMDSIPFNPGTLLNQEFGGEGRSGVGVPGPVR
jgi:hypothetical protein